MAKPKNVDRDIWHSGRLGKIGFDNSSDQGNPSVILNENSDTELARGRYRFFGLFRLLLASLVVLQHTELGSLPKEVAAVLGPLEVGSIAVLGFFALSGFVVTEAAACFYVGRPFAFIANRLLRIYPTYIVALALTAAVIAVVSPEGLIWAGYKPPTAMAIDSAANLGANLFLILPFGHRVFRQIDLIEIIDVAWAVRVELIFYFLLFVLFAIATSARMSLGKLLVAAGIAYLGGLVALYDWIDSNAFRNGVYFLLGIAIFFLVDAKEAKNRIIPVAFLAFAFIAITHQILGQTSLHPVAGFVRNREGQLILFWVIVAIWAALIFLGRLRLRDRAQIVRVDKLLGEVTYPLYLNHVAVMMVLAAYLPQKGLPTLLLAFPTSYAVAFVITVTFEAWISRLRSKVRGFSLR